MEEDISNSLLFLLLVFQTRLRETYINDTVRTSEYKLQHYKMLLEHYNYSYNNYWTSGQSI